MLHSVLIAHRDRNEHLELCLRSLGRSAQCSDAGDWEVLVVDSASANPPRSPHERVLVIHDRQPPEMFNKSRCLNLGIKLARGGVLTFLDADVVVGSLFLEGWRPLQDESLSRVCYRVRCLADPHAEMLLRPETDHASYLDHLFGRYNEQNGGNDIFRKGYEAYGRHARQRAPISEKHQPWGNSQFSIRRDTLGDLRFDEEYQGHGLEDLDFLMRLEALLAESYRAHIWIDGAHALFHLDHPPSSWRQKEFYEANWVRYRRKCKQLSRRQS